MISTKLNIHIVTVEGGWILPQLSKKWADQIVNCSVSLFPDHEADINYYVNYHRFAVLGFPKSNYDVGYFTHKEPAKPFDQVAAIMDHNIAMSKKTYNLLPEGTASLLSPIGADAEAFQERNLRLGVVSKNYPSGRKRLHLINEIEKINGVDIFLTGGGLSQEKLIQFYDEIDYIVILSSIEGGPMPVLESIHRRKPVIAPDVGWCWEFPVIKYDSTENLYEIINKLATPTITWEESARELLNILEKEYLFATTT